MKHLSKFLLAAFMIMGFTAVQAQDENNPWALGIGVNAVDFYPTGENAPLGGYFEDFFNVGDHWNILPGVSSVSLARNIGGGFYFEGAGSVNMIEKFGNESRDRMTYYGLDGTFNYSFRNDANAGWFDPFVGAGGGYTWLDGGTTSTSGSGGGNGPYSSQQKQQQTPGSTSGYSGGGYKGGATANGTAGVNFWFSDNLAFTLKTIYKYSFDYDKLPGHWQHVAGIKIAFGGQDTDGDGIYDKNDECPEVAGLPEFNGCPDSDGDGIEDRMDACPNEAGLTQFDGCPDTDGDGIADPQDECPTVAGTAAMNGCPDADGDGVRDSDDECPNEAGPAENNGCPFEDRDNDGVLDKDDECPDVAGSGANDGCPEPTVEVINELNEYSRTILFDLNKATIRDESEETLQSIADIMQEYPNTTFHIEGHTDSTGSESYNHDLSHQRAQAIKDFLVNAGISQERVTAKGYGESQPIATNSTGEGRQKNRRVEISLEGQEDQQGNTSGERNRNKQNNQGNN